MEKLLVSLIPCTLVVLSLTKVSLILNRQRNRESFSPVGLALTAGITAIAFLWAAVALNEGLRKGPLTPEFVKASWGLGPGLACCMVLVLFAPELLSAVGRIPQLWKRRP